jgi:4-azaleucine resistance transporter AzlC
MEKTVVNTKIIFLYTIPVLLGYIPLGMTYGILSIKSGIPFFPTVLMSIVVFAGSGQFLAVSLLSAHAGYFEIAISSFLLNLRHFFYGISIMDELKSFGLKRYYMIFGLTDETFALLKTWKNGEDDKENAFFKITLFNHLYWITGTVTGCILASTIDFNSKGIEFCLTVLFVVLTLELLMQQKNYKTFLLAAVVGFFSLLFFPASKMLILSLTVGVILLFLIRNIIDE